MRNSWRCRAASLRSRRRLFPRAEDYSKAIRRHVEVVHKFPENALAHYHLGFASGMVGDRKAEVTEYRRAEALGLKSWVLFLNLGLAQLENGKVPDVVCPRY